jgi:PIN domain nuclease of toxin-antitoxin system
MSEPEVRYLLDTHTVLWFLDGNKELLSQIARSIIEDQQRIKFVSLVSVWEVGIKTSIGKLKFPENTSGFVKQIQKNGFELLPITTDYVIAIEKLPHIHRDPFDRLLVATAVSEQLTIITADDNIARYNVSHIW